MSMLIFQRTSDQNYRSISEYHLFVLAEHPLLFVVTTSIFLVPEQTKIFGTESFSHYQNFWLPNSSLKIVSIYLTAATSINARSSTTFDIPINFDRSKWSHPIWSCLLLISASSEFLPVSILWSSAMASPLSLFSSTFSCLSSAKTSSWSVQLFLSGCEFNIYICNMEYRYDWL